MAWQWLVNDLAVALAWHCRVVLVAFGSWVRHEVAFYCCRLDPQFKLTKNLGILLDLFDGSIPSRGCPSFDG